MMQSTIGLDVSKDTLDAYHLERDESQSFINSKAGHKALIAWINEPARLVYEPTGPYHRAIVGALAQAEIDLVEVNPRRLRRFADVLGVPAKTDCLLGLRSQDPRFSQDTMAVILLQECAGLDHPQADTLTDLDIEEGL